MNYSFACIAVKMMLEHPFDYEWSTQGFGMLRTHFDADKRFRLNIWDSRLAVPLCSIIHDHPWSFNSMILAGEFSNVRYTELADTPAWPTSYEWQTIQTGPGGGPDGPHGRCVLFPGLPEHYGPGDTYHQEPTEIHASYYTDGTITLNDRTRLPDGEHARVFWPIGSKWIDAMPRRATIDEIADITFTALERLKHA